MERVGSTDDAAAAEVVEASKKLNLGFGDVVVGEDSAGGGGLRGMSRWRWTGGAGAWGKAGSEAAWQIGAQVH